MVRFVSILLLLISALNAIGADTSGIVAAPSEEMTAFAPLADISQSVGTKVDLSDHASSDCGESHQDCHQCHLGHCNFLVRAVIDLLLPNWKTDRIAAENEHYLGFIPPGLNKPPRA